MPSAVNLILVEDGAGGSDEFQPQGGLAASSSTFSSGVPVSPVVLEGPTSNGNATRFIACVFNGSNQEHSFAGAGNGIALQAVADINYAFDPSFEQFSNRQLRRGTGGNLDVVNPLYDEGAATDDTGVRAGQDVRAFLYAEDDADPLQAIRLVATAAGALRTSGGASTTITTVADATGVGTSATSLAAANTSRTSVIVQNIGATNTARVGDTNITTSRGIRLAPGESVTLETTAQIFGLSEASTTDFAITELE
jgi:hypothetical protein